MTPRIKPFSKDEVLCAIRVLQAHRNDEVEDVNNSIPIEDLHNKVEELPKSECRSLKDPEQSLTDIAALANADSLGAEDLFHLLAHQKKIKFFQKNKIISEIRGLLLHQYSPPLGVKLEFKTVNLLNGGQISYVILEPENMKNEDPIILLPGLRFSAAGYVKSFGELSKVTGRRIIIINHLGVGGSKWPKKADLHTIIATTEMVIQHEPHLQKKSLTLIGHSFGCWLALAIHTHQKQFEKRTSTQLARTVLLSPIPSYEDDYLGYKMVGVNYPQSRKDLDILRWQPPIVPIDTASALELLIATHPTLARHDNHQKNLRIVLAKNDDLYTLSNSEEWKKFPGITVYSRDHSWMVGWDTPTQEVVETLQDAVEGPISNPQEGSRERQIRHSTKQLFVGLGGEPLRNLGAELKMINRLGLTGLGPLILDAGFSPELLFGAGFADKKYVHVELGNRMEVGATVARTPFRFNLGTRIGVSFNPEGTNYAPEVRASLFAGFEYRFSNIFYYQVQLNQNIWTNRQDIQNRTLGTSLYFYFGMPVFRF